MDDDVNISNRSSLAIFVEQHAGGSTALLHSAEWQKEEQSIR